eukprot:TRINITY_DN9471_c0_g1_i1.p1 TRINITY_DN9471_c0_g1~~TRINITY_DN9471_c0_g1_i1.p1  ORF type:complete len:128 (+),score=22.77 TRINITY_DN9471_c0_g1_i1:65-448(+)
MCIRDRNNTTPIEYSQISAYLINNDIPFIQFWLAVSPDSIRTQLSILSANVIQKMETFTTDFQTHLLVVACIFLFGIFFSYYRFDRKITADMVKTKLYLKNIHPEIIVNNQRLRTFLIKKKLRELEN